MNQKLENAINLYLVGIRDGKPEQAIQAYTGHRYTQHSAGVKTGRAGFVEFFQEFLQRNPKREIEVLRSIVDGRYVFVHVAQSLNDGESRWVTMDMFDTGDDDRIIEHWDVIAAHSPTPSGTDLVGGETEVTDLEQTGANRFRVNDFLKLALVEGEDCFDDFVDADIVQHSSRLEGGIDGWRQWQRSGVYYEFVLNVIGQGNFVASLSRLWIDGRDHAGFNLFRLKAGKIVEHWDCIEEIAPREQWVNSGKF